MESKKLGKFGEEIACQYLENKGYQVLVRNYFKNWSGRQKGEIDIVAKKDKIISFIEVKTLLANTNTPFLPEDKVDFNKQKQLLKLAQMWLQENKMQLASQWQVDVVSIKVNLKSKKAKIQHFKNVVS